MNNLDAPSQPSSDKENKSFLTAEQATDGITDFIQREKEQILAEFRSKTPPKQEQLIRQARIRYRLPKIENINGWIADNSITITNFEIRMIDTNDLELKHTLK